VLEWRPRLIALVLVIVLIAVFAGIFDFGLDNWEW
jgi:hypothetical protein